LAVYEKHRIRDKDKDKVKPSFVEKPLFYETQEFKQYMKECIRASTERHKNKYEAETIYNERLQVLR
jgi:hypothetical protein